MERKLSAAVAIVSLGLLLVFILLFFAAGLSPFFVLPSLAGGGLVALGLLLPVPKRPKRHAQWLGPSAARIAVGSGVFGLVFAVLYGIMVVAAQSGHPIPRAIGLSTDSAIILVISVWGVIGGCFATCIITLLASGGWAVARQYGFLRMTNSLYLAASPLLLLILCACGIASKWTQAAPSLAYHPPAPQMNHNGSMTPGWPSDPAWPSPSPMPMRHSEIPPMMPPMPMRQVGPGRMGPRAWPAAVLNPNDPEFYRKMLAELRSPDVNHRRIAVMVLQHVEPKELRSEITKALETLMDEPDGSVRDGSLRALDVWSTDVVPIAIRALADSSVLVSNNAIDILGAARIPAPSSR